MSLCNLECILKTSLNNKDGDQTANASVQSDHGCICSLLLWNKA